MSPSRTFILRPIATSLLDQHNGGPLGITIVGGLLVSQLLTLYTTPVIYLFFDRLAVRFATARTAQAGMPVLEN